MRYDLVTYVLGWILLCLGASMLCPLIVAWCYNEPTGAFWLSILLVVVVGWAMTRLRPGDEARGELSAREGFLIVSGGWILSGLFGAIPFFLDGTFVTQSPEQFSPMTSIQSFTDSAFETISGFTTTGASVLTDFEAPSKSMFFWRSLTHWLGGMGIIVLAIAVLPLVGVGGLRLFRAEVPGPTADRIRPRVVETARTLWLIYLGLTVVETVLLAIGGMDLFDAVCHAFGTVATGGFSTKNASIGYYPSSYIQIVVGVFMFLAGTNFALHYAALRGNFRAFWRDPEFRVFTGIILISTLLCTFSLHFQGILYLFLLWLFESHYLFLLQVLLHPILNQGLCVAVCL